MAFDGIVLKNITNELKELINGKINKIQQSSKDNLTLSIYNQKSYNLYIDISANNYRVNLTTHSEKNLQTPSNFCMVLRKYITSAKITNIYSLGLERILYIEFETYNEMNDLIKRYLVCELMGKYSNILLLNEHFNIIDALKKFDGNDISRDIMPGRHYNLPNDIKNDFTKTSEAEFINIINNSEFKTLETAIPSLFTGISKLYIQSLINELKLSNTISDKSLKEIYKAISDSITNGKGINFKNNYTIVPTTNSKNLELNNFLDKFYYNKNKIEDFNNYKSILLKIINNTLDKITSKLLNIDEKIKSTANMDELKLYGELILANIYQFNEKELEYNKISKLKVVNYYTNENVEIEIDFTKSLSKNADNYFKKYNKAKNTLKVCKIQQEETNKELDYLQSLLYQLDNSTTITDLDDIYDEINEQILFTDSALKKIKKHQNPNQKPKKAELPSLTNYIKTTVDDYQVLIGKNNKQNDYLTKTVANESDIWMHTKDIHGSHVILRTNGQTPKISTIEKVASLAAYYSKARFSSHVPVDYTQIKYVKKPNGSVPGYVIYTNNKTIYVTPSSLLTTE
ncbi:MAG: NFACT family protein [Clostridiales bacterium]|nr:NFACT family protein [Clostridiales bacterium]